MKVIIPPIKSQGIKTKLVPWIKSVISDNINGYWIEPFLGTGVVAFNSGFDKLILNDINPHIINFYNQLKNDIITPFKVSEYLTREGWNLSQSDEDGYVHYRYIRDRFNKSFAPLDFLFLSRAGFNGMIRFNKSGKWNVPFCKKPNRFSKSYITKIINQVKKVRKVITNNWTFYNKSFNDIIKLATNDDIIYCDPPYLGRYVDYYNGWTEDNEKTLYELLCKTKAKFILSTWHHNDFRENVYIKKYWNKFNMVTRDHFYHSGGNITNRRSIVEALFLNFETDILQHNHEIEYKSKQLALSF